MSERIYDALEVCLSAVKTGVPVQQCQAIYPDLSKALTPVVEAAQAARSLSTSGVPAAAQHYSRSRLWEQATRLERRQSRAFWFSRSLSPLRFVILLAVLLAAASLNGLVVASAQSLPGDALYPLKRVTERVTMQLAPAPQMRHQAEMAYIQRRIEEVNQLIRAGRIEPVSFEGTLVRQSADTWLVDNVPVQIDGLTRFSGDVSPGALLEIEGVIQPDGRVQADEVHVRSFQFTGQVISMGQTSWNINGTDFQVLVDSQIDSSVRVGDTVLVLGRSEDDHLYYASAIIHLPDRVGLLARQTSAPAIQMEWRATVRSMAADSWLVGARTVLLSVNTQVKAPIQIGDLVLVQGWLQPDGSLLANQISLLPDSASAAEDSQNSTPGFSSLEKRVNAEDPQGSQPVQERSSSLASQNQPNQLSKVKDDSDVQVEADWDQAHDSPSKYDSGHTAGHSEDQSDSAPVEQSEDD